jgi:hypothetical protein
MKTVRPGLFVYLFVVVSFLLLAGCGGLSSRTSAASPMPAPSASPTPTPVSSAKLVYTITGSGVAGFTLQSDAKLQPIPSLASAGNLDKTQLVVSPDGQWLFTITGCPPSLCADRGAVFSQSIRSDGTLGTPTMVIPSSQLIIGVVIDQSSRFVYALSDVVRVPPVDPSTGCSSITQVLTAYALGTGGGLAPLNSTVATVNTGDCPLASGGFPITTLVGFHQDTTGNFLLLTHDDLGRGSDSPSLFSIPVAANGTLGALKTTPIGQFTNPGRNVIAGQYLVTNEQQNVLTGPIPSHTTNTFRLQNGDFQLAFQCPASVSACVDVVALAASPNGKVVYTLSGATAGVPLPALTVNALTLDSSTGALVPFGKSVTLPSGAFSFQFPQLVPSLVTVDSQGSFLFVSRNNDSTITTIALDPTTGALGTAVDSPAGALPNAIVSATR